MLGKLLKYEWKATSRTFLPLYLAVVITTIINAFSLKFSDFEQYDQFPWIQGILVFLYGAIIIATFALTLAVMIQRYYKNILGTEGYLMNTLPVKGWQLILSKGLLSLLWLICSVLVVVISIPAAMFIAEPSTIKEFLHAFDSIVWDQVFFIWGGVGGFTLFLLELFLCIVVASAGSIMKIYAAMSLGHMVHKYRLLASVGFYVGLGVLENVILAIIGMTTGDRISSFMEKFFFNMEPENIGNMTNGMLLFGIIFYAIPAIIYFFVSKYIVDSKLNLE